MEIALKGLNRFKDVEAMWIKNARLKQLTADQRFISYYRIFTFEAYWKVTQITIEKVYEEMSVLEVTEEFKKTEAYRPSLMRIECLVVE